MYSSYPPPPQNSAMHNYMSNQPMQMPNLHYVNSYNNQNINQAYQFTESIINDKDNRLQKAIDPRIQMFSPQKF